jgi:hypothetical protein
LRSPDHGQESEAHRYAAQREPCGQHGAYMVTELIAFVTTMSGLCSAGVKFQPT